MTAGEAFTAFRVADRLRGRVEGPWEVYGEKVRRFEIHLNGPSIEMERGPIAIEGFGLRLLRAQGDATGVGFAAASDLKEATIDERVAAAEATAAHARFPARRVELPGTAAKPVGEVASFDPALWAEPPARLRAYVAALVAPFEGRAGTTLSFGSVKATLVETTLANSEGLQRHFRRTRVDLEAAVKSFDGPEGPAPGEYWVNERSVRLDPAPLPAAVARWCERARDVRSAKPMPSGLRQVVVPPEILADVLPSILGYRLTGSAELRKMAPEPGTRLGTPLVTIHDDGRLPYGPATAPCDDEGRPTGRRAVVEAGVSGGIAYDALHAGAFGQPPTGSGRRDSFDFAPWFRFHRPPHPTVANLVVAPGELGDEAEILERVGDGLWLDQLGYAFPDPMSGAFGGEVRIAYRIRHGKRAEPLRGGTVGGVVFGPEGSPSLLGSVRGIGSRSTLAGYLASPPMWVDGLSVAGAE